MEYILSSPFNEKKKQKPLMSSLLPGPSERYSIVEDPRAPAMTDTPTRMGEYV